MHVAIIMGSDTDWLVAKEACEMLKKFNVQFEAHVLSAYRSPLDLINYVKHCEDMGCGIFICMAGKWSNLPGIVASHTKQPVIGVPLTGGNLGTGQMPPGVPVAMVTLDGGTNAAILAVQMLSLRSESLAKQLSDYKEGLRQSVLAKDHQVQEWVKALGQS